MKIKHEREPRKECFWEHQTIYLFERQEPLFYYGTVSDMGNFSFQLKRLCYPSHLFVDL